MQQGKHRTRPSAFVLLEDPAKSHPVGAASPEPQAMPGSAFGSLGLDHVSSLLAFSAPSAQEDWARAVDVQCVFNKCWISSLSDSCVSI